LRRLCAPSRLGLAGLIAVGIAGCSADTSRFADNPFASPARNEATAAVAPVHAAPRGRIESQALPPPASYNTPRSDVTGSVPTGSAARANWNRDGGTSITVASGDTLGSIAHRYGVPASAIMQANGISAAATLRAGQRLVIPRFNHNGNLTPRVAAGPANRVPANAKAVPVAGTHVVVAGETLSSVAAHYGKRRGALAKANNLVPDAQIRIGQRLAIPGVRPTTPPTVTAAAQPGLATDWRAPEAKVASRPQVPVVPNATQKMAKNDPAANAHITTPTEPSIEGESGPTGETTGSTPSFRWPVRGRIITAFGPRASGPQNDGINLSVPEGTSVKASEDGVVAYAGNELKGYGNLVLLRHGNGYVTAYAHASELMVKRGDHVKRGQVIARAGQTGNVPAPQLHFEIRKGKAPVDPTQLLPPPT